ncbi:MAG: hypothetical protein LBU12_05410 [Deltaproteobacteria bacterium]|jgi:hypothetical protein|nr:hypothetical protein [Deltaproteobacteria bacterium]
MKTLMLAFVTVLALSAAQLQAQNVSGDFQFEELDFDRQPAPAARALDGEKAAPGGQDDLQQLFGDPEEPAPPNVARESVLNLPGEPSPVSPPSGQGEAKIERVAKSEPAVVQARRPAAVRQVRWDRWRYVVEAWRGRPDAQASSCVSYVAERPLYHVKCLGAVGLARR